MIEENKKQQNKSEKSQEGNNQETGDQEPFAGANRATMAGGQGESASSDEPDSQAEEEGAPDTKILDPGGIMILIIAFGFDVLGWICAALIAAFGIGVILGQIVNVFGFLTIAFLLKMHNKDKADDILQDKVWDIMKTLFKKNKINSIAEILPGIGDIWPGFTLMAYKGLS